MTRSMKVRIRRDDKKEDIVRRIVCVEASRERKRLEKEEEVKELEW